MDFLFPDLSTASAWQDARCVELGIPYPGDRGKADLSKQWTVAFAEPELLNDGTALVRGLPAKEPVPKNATIVTTTIIDYAVGKLAVDAKPVTKQTKQVYEKPLPPVWKDPSTGIDEPVPVRGAVSVNQRPD